MRRDLELGDFAGGIIVLVQGNLQAVGSFGGRRGDIPARVELVAGRRAFRIRGFDLEPVLAPVDRNGDGGVAVGAKVDLAVGDRLGEGDRLVAPRIVGAVPLVIALDLDQRPLRAFQRLALAIRIDRDQAELGGAALRHLAIGEIRTNADHMALRADADVERALDGAPTGLAHAHRHLAVDELRGRRQLVDGDREGRLAVIANHRQIGERRDRRFRRLFVGEAEGEVGETVPVARGRQRQLAFQGKTRRRRAIEEAAVDVDVGRFAARDLLLVGLHVEFDAIRHEVLDQEHLAGHRRLLGIGVDRNRPGAAHRIGFERQVDGVAAGRCPVADDATVLDAVGTREDEGQRQVLHRLGGAIAGKGGDMDILAGAVDAALGPGIDVERAGCCAPGDATIGEVKAGLGHVEEDEVIVTLLGHQHGGHHAAVTARQARVEHGVALGIRRRGAENLVVPGNQGQFGPRDRLGGAQRTGKYVQPILAGIGRQADVGDDEPLRGQRIVAVALVVDGLSGQHIDAGLALRQRLVDREGRGDLLVEVVDDVELALPDRRAHLLGNVGDVVAVELVQELVARQKLRQRAVADAIELHLGRVHVDGDDRNAAARAGRQHEAVAGEAGGRGAVLHIDRQHGGRGGDFADRGRQAGTEGDVVMLAVLEPFDADLLVLGLDALGRRVVDGDELSIVDAGLDQLLGELGADARRAGVGVDAVVDDAETLAGFQIGIVGLDGRRRHQRKARLIGLQSGPVEIALVEAGAEQRQHIRAGLARAQQLVGIEGGGGAVCRQSGCFGGVGGGLHGQRLARQVEPELAVVRHHRDRGLVFLHGGAMVAGLDRLFGGADQGRHALGRLVEGRTEQLVAVLLGLIGHPVGEEGEFRRGADIGIAVDVDDLAGHRAVERLQLVIVGFEKAPFGLGVVGEGATGRIAKACRLALVEGDILVGSEVKAEIVGIVRCRDSPGFGRLRDAVPGQDIGPGDEKKDKNRQTTSRAHCHNTLRTICRRPDMFKLQSGLSTRGRGRFRLPTVYFPAKDRYADSNLHRTGITLSCGSAEGVNSKPVLFQTIGLWPLYERFRTSFQF